MHTFNAIIYTKNDTNNEYNYGYLYFAYIHDYSLILFCLSIRMFKNYFFAFLFSRPYSCNISKSF